MREYKSRQISLISEENVRREAAVSQSVLGFVGLTRHKMSDRNPESAGLKRRSRWWRGRLGEFLKARIIPKRIVHRIVPEERGNEWRNLSEKFLLLFRCEGGDDFLEARIATKSIPVLLELEHAVTQTIR